MSRPFDICGPLPSGVTVLEASAGTGKTYAIAALAARYVAEGTPLDRLLLVTFTRMATGELRERVRERLVGVERGLTRVLAGVPPSGDEVVRLLAGKDVALRRDRLRRALADFDAATIATTHGFCQEVLGGLGIAGDLEPDTCAISSRRSSTTCTSGASPAATPLLSAAPRPWRSLRRRSRTRRCRSRRRAAACRRCAGGSRARRAWSSSSASAGSP
jgi:superfamily I DNA/RNA helicase